MQSWLLPCGLQISVIPFAGVSTGNSTASRVTCLSMKTGHISAGWRAQLKERLCTGFVVHKQTAVTRFDASRVSVTWPGDLGSATRMDFQWDEVESVSAYKKDCFAIDQLRLVFKAAQGVIEITEDIEGWDRLVEALPGYLPGMLAKAEWWGPLVQPARPEDQPVYRARSTLGAGARSHRGQRGSLPARAGQKRVRSRQERAGISPVLYPRPIRPDLQPG